MWKVSVVAVLGAAVLAGGCSPQMKTAGYVGGTTLLLGGVAARMDAEYGDHHGFEDLGLVLGEYYFGTAAAITGAFIVIAALASPSESKDPAAAPPPAPLPTSSLVPPPSGSPSPPSGSPSARLEPPVQLQGQALSMRGPSSPAFR